MGPSGAPTAVCAHTPLPTPPSQPMFFVPLGGELLEAGTCLFQLCCLPLGFTLIVICHFLAPGLL